MRDDLRALWRRRDPPGLLLALAAGLMSLGTTCNGNQDYLLLESPIAINTKLGGFVAHQIANDTPYDARNRLDFVLSNANGAEDMKIAIGAFAATSLSADLDAECAVDDVSDVPDVDDAASPFDFDLGLGGAADADTPEPDGLGGAGIRFPDLADLINDLDTSNPCDDTAAGFQEITIPPGARVAGRIPETTLGTGALVTIVVQCLSPTCEGTLELALLLSQLDCRSNDDCSADESCDALGRCAALPAEPSCQAAGPGEPPAPLLLLLALAAIAAAPAWARRPGPPLPSTPAPRRGALDHRAPFRGARSCGSPRSAGGARAALLLAACAAGMAATLLAPGVACAQRNDFNRASAQTSLGFGVRSWTGLLAEDSRTGITMDWSQSLQYRNLGARISVGTAFFLTDQEPPPSAKGMQTYSLTLGPRAILPWRSFRLFADVEYERLGVISNALVRQTGQDLSFNGLGAALGGQWLYGPVLISARASFTQVLEFDAGLLGFTLNLGLNGEL